MPHVITSGVILYVNIMMQIMFKNHRNAEDISIKYMTSADPSGRAVYGKCLRHLACWYCGFEYR
jgi:hypothetical protein